MLNRKKENIETLKILILDSGRQTLPFLKSYKKAGYHTTLISNTWLNECYFSRYPSEKFIWPDYMSARNEFEDRLFNFLENNETDVVISLSDITSDILSKNRDKISELSAVTQPKYDIFSIGANKLNLMIYCMDNGFPCPKTYALSKDSFKYVKDKLDFPVIVKPVGGVGALGVSRINSIEELEERFDKLNNEFGNLIIQEYIPVEDRNQYMAEAFVDNDGKMQVCVVIEKSRIFPVKAGTSSANVTVIHPEITDITKRLLESLKWRGAADIDFIVDPRDNIPKILEINPRVTAGIKIAFSAGVDFADMFVKLALGQNIPEIKKYRQEVYCRNFFLEILWFLTSSFRMKKETSPSFFKIWGRNMCDQLFSVDDPLTWLGFFLHMLKKYLSIKKLRAKFHY